MYGEQPFLITYYLQIEMERTWFVSRVLVTSRLNKDFRARYNKVQVQVGNVNAMSDVDTNRNAAMVINQPCDGVKTYGVDGGYNFNHICQPGPIMGKYVTVQLTDTSIYSSFDVTEAAIFIKTDISGKHPNMRIP